MKNIKILIFWITLIIYEEIVFSCEIFGKFPENFLWILLFSLPIALFFSIITSIFKSKVNKWLTYIIVIGIIFVFGAQLVYYSMYQAIISFFSFMNGGQVTEFMEIIFDKIYQNGINLLFLFLPIVMLIVLHKFKIILFERENIKTIIMKIISLVLIHITALILINNINTEEMYSNQNLYYNIHVPKVTVNRLGLFTTMRLDFQRYISGFEENLTIEVNSLPEEVINNEIKYNVTSIDLEKINEQETDQELKLMNEYFANQMPTEQNEYTGMFEGKNLVVFVAEAFSTLAIQEDLTPTLYKLYNEGFQFDNFYTPIFPVSTADGEYITDTSLIPKEGVWSLYRVAGNYMPYSYANVFKNLGYSTNAYHNHTATYYHRDEYIKTMGYDSYLAVGTGLEERMNCNLWPNSDYEMVSVTTEDYINNEHFLAYYMTVSGHMNYTTLGNSMSSRNWDKVKDLPYSHKAKAYLAANIELDKAVEKLIKNLEEAGKLEDTVIVISADHYPYGLTLDEINELSTYERDDLFEKCHMPFLIWNSSMEAPITVDKLGSSLDVLPTILNLFGIEYDSRLLMGRDILSSSTPIVIFSDRSFITDKGKYNAVTGEFQANEGIEIEEGYIDEINTIIYNKYKMSSLILDKNYYKYLWDKQKEIAQQ